MFYLNPKISIIGRSIPSFAIRVLAKHMVRLRNERGGTFDCTVEHVVLVVHSSINEVCIFAYFTAILETMVWDPRPFRAKIPYTLGSIVFQFPWSNPCLPCEPLVQAMYPYSFNVSNSPDELTVSISLIVPHGGGEVIDYCKSDLSPLDIRMFTFTQSHSMQVALPPEPIEMQIISITMLQVIVTSTPTHSKIPEVG